MMCNDVSMVMGIITGSNIKVLEDFDFVMIVMTTEMRS